MRVAELDLKNLLELDPEGGLVRFAGQRALIFDTVAQGLLRKELDRHVRRPRGPGDPEPLRLHPRSADGRGDEHLIQVG